MTGVDKIDVSDPCARADVLRKALVRLLAGEQVAETSFESGPTGSRRLLRFSKVDVPVLREELAKAEAECAALQGCRTRARIVKFSTSKGI